MSRARQRIGNVQQRGFHIEVSWPGPTARHARELLARVAEHALCAAGFSAGTLSIAVVDARTMSRLHQRHTGIAGPTDVLTFDLGGDVRVGHVDGEIVVCAPVAAAAVRIRFGPTRPRASAVRVELALYVVHGVLHLAGYDDHSAPAAREMHAREDELLTELGLGAVYNPPARAAPKRRGRTAARRSKR